MTVWEQIKSKTSLRSSQPSFYRQREKWAKGIEFLLSTVAFAVGLGNAWRFPYLCYKNGGGAFLVPYFCCLLLGGVPVFFMEIGIGQLTSQGGISVWEEVAPIFKGIGYASALICFYLNIYYIVILAWVVHYFIASFTLELPWTSCNHTWNTKDCFTSLDPIKKNKENSSIFQTTDATVEYWERRVLGLTKGIDEIGGIQWELAGTLFLSWIVVYFCVWKGVKSTGKAVYVTATFPYIMMTILFVRGITLDGAWEGIKYYVVPELQAIFHGPTWIDAGTQIFFSYAIALGCMTALGSYNNFHHNFVRDCTYIVFINSGTSMYVGFVIFSVLGFMAHEQGVPISRVAESGPGLAFIAYPKAVSQLPASPIWSALFFFMLILLGLGSQFVAVEGFITAIVDIFPHILRFGYRREVFIAAVSLVSFLIGVSMVTGAGMYVFQIFDYYSASGMCLLWVCFWETIAITYVYGLGRFCHDIKRMVGYEISRWFPLCWAFITPIITMGLLIYSVIRFTPLTYNRTYKYPLWAQIFGLCLAVSSMATIPIYFFNFFVGKSIKKAEAEEQENNQEQREPLVKVGNPTLLESEQGSLIPSLASEISRTETTK